jgi:hypothetical protein
LRGHPIFAAVYDVVTRAVERGRLPKTAPVVRPLVCGSARLPSG